MIKVRRDQFRVLDSEDQMACALVEEWLEAAEEAMPRAGRFTAALSGGKGPASHRISSRPGPEEKRK